MSLPGFASRHGASKTWRLGVTVLWNPLPAPPRRVQDVALRSPNPRSRNYETQRRNDAKQRNGLREGSPLESLPGLASSRLCVTILRNPGNRNCETQRRKDAKQRNGLRQGSPLESLPGLASPRLCVTIFWNPLPAPPRRVQDFALPFSGIPGTGIMKREGAKAQSRERTEIGTERREPEN